jgi:hypothetical protein
MRAGGQAIGAILRKQIRAPEKERPPSGLTGEQARRTRSKGDSACLDHETGGRACICGVPCDALTWNGSRPDLPKPGGPFGPAFLIW